MTLVPAFRRGTDSLGRGAGLVFADASVANCPSELEPVQSTADARISHDLPASALPS